MAPDLSVPAGTLTVPRTRVAACNPSWEEIVVVEDATRWPTHWPRAARESAENLVRAVEAASAERRDDFEDAVSDLAGIPYEQVVRVASPLVRSVLEVAFADLPDADDLRGLLRDTVVATAAWYPEIAPAGVAAVLTGTWQLDDPDGARQDGTEILAAAAAVVARCVTTTARAPRDRPDPRTPDARPRMRTDLAATIRAAVGEVERADTVEMP